MKKKFNANVNNYLQNAKKTKKFEKSIDKV